MKRTTRFVREEELTEAERKTIAEWTRDLFGAAEDAYEWDTPTYRVLVYADNELASHLSLHDRTIDAGGTLLRVAAIGGVMTPASRQGQGFGSYIMKEATRFAREDLKVDFGFLLCSDSLVPFYERLGWQEIDAEVAFNQPQGTVMWQERAMFLPVNQEEWPSGAVNLRGLPM